MKIWKNFKGWLYPSDIEEGEHIKEQPSLKEKLLPKSSKYDIQIVLFKPRTYEEVQKFAQSLKEGKVVVVNLTVLRKEISQRTLDFLAGTLFALDGSIHPIEETVFLFAPKDVKVEDNLIEKASTL